MKLSIQSALEALDRAIDEAFDKAAPYLRDLSHSDLNRVIHEIEEGYVNKQLIIWIKDIAEDNITEEDIQDIKDAHLEDSWRNE
ncbi:hypothetical protein UFOVP754_34 [uncultured Caudovirales phage]|uniref:Uncharacterized protein n=1 Tax=uncultured Caudovirales phage TaxID=2100421 RepID=A0A6J7X863_9CAUD|nr:hypothetical protein UFOVP754_34 [uncultured Caudovirales phage]